MADVLIPLYVAEARRLHGDWMPLPRAPEDSEDGS